LDASRKGLPFGMLPYSALNARGYLIDSKKNSWILLKEKATHSEFFIVNLEVKGDSIIGEMKSHLSDYAAYNFYLAEDEDEENEYKEDFKENLASEWDWNEFEFSEIEKGKPVRMTGSISKEINTDDLIYVEPSLFRIFSENPFKNKERISPVNIPYKIEYELIYNLTIPEGYTVEEKPTSNKIILEGTGELLYAVGNDGNKLSINILFKLNKLDYTTKEEYKDLHGFFEEFHKQMENVVVLKKL